MKSQHKLGKVDGGGGGAYIASTDSAYEERAPVGRLSWAREQAGMLETRLST